MKIVKKKSKKRTFYQKAHKILAPVIRFFQRVKVTGLENIPTEGPVLFCSNHMAVRDPILIAAACKRQITFIAKKELFRVPVIGWLIKKLGAIPVDRASASTSTIKASVDVLKSGGAIAIFPQGHRYPSVNPAETPVKNGAAMLTYRSRCDVIPVCIKTKNFKYSFLRKKEIIFGEPMPYSAFGFTGGGTEEYKEATAKMFAEVIRLGGFDSLPAPAKKKEDGRK